MCPIVEGPIGFNWNACPNCGHEADWDDEESDLETLKLYCHTCKIEGTVRRFEAGKVPVKWLRSNQLRHNPVLEGLNAMAGFAPAGVYIRLEGTRQKVLEKLDPDLVDGLKSLFPEVFG